MRVLYLALYLAAMLFCLAEAAHAQTDPNGYAIICNSSCQLSITDEQGRNAMVSVGQGYVMDRIDLLPGETMSLPDNESIIADPSLSMAIGSASTSMPQGVLKEVTPAPIQAGPLPSPP